MDTPFSKFLVYIGMTQKALAEKTGLLQPTISRLVTGSLRMSRDMAKFMLDWLDPKREIIDELRLLYPERYPDWKPPENVLAAAAGAAAAAREEQRA